MAAMTLLEAAKLYSGDTLRPGVIQAYAGSSDILKNLMFDNIPGGSLSYIQEKTMPASAFRGINESYENEMGDYLVQTENLCIIGSQLIIDSVLMKANNGTAQQAARINSQVRAIGLDWTAKFFKGDRSVNPRVFDGLQKRITGTQLIANGSTSGGDALSLKMLDTLISRVEQPTHLIMSKDMRINLVAAARNSSVAGYITYGLDQFGAQVTMYSGLPILTVDYDNTNTLILPFNEAAPAGGSSVSTSIYCVSIREDGLIGIQNGDINVVDLGVLQNQPANGLRFEWLSSFAILDRKAAARLYGVVNAAVVA